MRDTVGILAACDGEDVKIGSHGTHAHSSALVSGAYATRHSIARIVGGAATRCALAAFAVGSCAAQQKPPESQKPALAAGAKLYRENCAVCHGNDGKGNGPPPASSSFTEIPPDLTTLAKRHDRKFPDAYVESVLRNGVPVPDHGPEEMPVWGTIFKATTKSDEAKVTQRINNLTGYLKSIQEK
jgi:mono/diheme cytochrome c family protein